MTAEELAVRAGMDAGYIQYLEQSPSAEPAPRTVVRLAAALGVPPALLRGPEASAPGDDGGAAARLLEMPNEECLDRLRPGGVGRAVVMSEQGPVAVPVNFRMLDDDPVFRTEPQSLLAQAEGQSASIEVDHLDQAFREGWSVLVSGTMHRLSDKDLDRARSLGVRPWAAGERPLYLTVKSERVTGRRLVSS